MKHSHFVRLVALSIPFATALPVVSAAPRGNVRRPVVRGNVAVSGIVSRVINTREFDLHVGARSIHVKTDAFQNLKPGDYVTARGQLRGNTMRAETLNRRDDNVRGNQGRESVIDFRGEVIEVEGPQALRVRAMNNRVYAVRTVGGMARRISRGDIVHVRGTFDGSFVRADNGAVIVLIDNGAPKNGNGGGFGFKTGQRVNFRAKVTRVLRRGEVEVRTDSGVTLLVREPAALVGYTKAGDQVQIQGIARGGYIAATNIDRVS